LALDALHLYHDLLTVILWLSAQCRDSLVNIDIEGPSYDAYKSTKHTNKRKVHLQTVEQGTEVNKD